MGKKKKIREEFEQVFESGDEKAIKKMLKKYPWLMDEISGKIDEKMGIQEQIIAALGVMEDELGGPVPINEIITCLKEDFNSTRNINEIRDILLDVESHGYVKKEPTGWALTPEGGKICDEFLNKNLNKLGLKF